MVLACCCGVDDLPYHRPLASLGRFPAASPPRMASLLAGVSRVPRRLEMIGVSAWIVLSVGKCGVMLLANPAAGGEA